MSSPISSRTPRDTREDAIKIFKAELEDAHTVVFDNQKTHLHTLWKAAVETDVECMKSDQSGGLKATAAMIRCLHQPKFNEVASYIKEQVRKDANNSIYLGDTQSLLKKHGFFPTKAQRVFSQVFENPLALALGEMFPSSKMTGNYALLATALTIISFIESHTSTGSTPNENVPYAPSANNTWSTPSQSTAGMSTAQSVACLLALGILAINLFRECRATHNRR